jgi:hypothetical protein
VPGEGAGMPRDLTDPAARRLVLLNRVASVAFVLGGSLFALGACFAGLGVGTLVTVNVTYLVGGFFFSLGGYTSVLLASNGVAGPMHWWSRQPGRRDWLSSVVLFAGTLFFAVSLVAAFVQGLTPRQSDTWIWLPDIIGCVCFLVSGHLAMLSVGDGHVVLRPREVTWWVVVVNQVGSVLFFLAGLAAFTRPATSGAVNIAIVNWGTFTGAVCFAIGGVIQIFDQPTPTRAAPTRTVVRPTHDQAH